MKWKSILLFLLFAACDNGQTLAPGATAWAETTVPFDPTCANCEELATVQLGHGGNVVLMVDPNVNDHEAQWVHCVSSVLDCIEIGGEMSTCVEGGSCPSVCSNEYRAALENSADTTDFHARWNAFELTFLEPTGPCSAESNAEVEVVT